MTARTSSPPRALEFDLADGSCIRMSVTSMGVVGELWRDGACLTQARFLNFAAAGQWVDAELRLAARPYDAGAVRELFAP